jgi:hypothetical protein
MKIEYFERDNLFWGLILRHSIDENNKDYISHTLDTVTYKSTVRDVHDEIQIVEVTATRNFIKLRNEIISDHKEKIAELQNEINILSVDTYKLYQFEMYDPNGCRNRNKNKGTTSQYTTFI